MKVISRSVGHDCSVLLWELERKEGQSNPFRPGSIVECDCGQWWRVTVYAPMFRRWHYTWYPRMFQHKWVKVRWWQK